MHSSSLKSTDFQLTVNRNAVSHASYFDDVRKTTRLGIYTPNRFDGVGAAALCMAHTTAFYDRYREAGGDFFAYPDFFTFQSETPVADYGMLDIWPNHKMVHVEGEGILPAITDRGVQILLVPETEGERAIDTLHKVVVESARRTIVRCYTYDPSGDVSSADVTVTCPSDPILGWIENVFDSIDEDGSREAKADWFAERGGGESITQSYKEIELDEALRILVPKTEM